MFVMAQAIQQGIPKGPHHGCSPEVRFETQRKRQSIPISQIRKENILRAWAGALTLLRCCFKLPASVGPSLLSSTGFPEGDGMSCVAMAVIAAGFNEWISAKAPLCRAIWTHQFYYFRNLFGFIDIIMRCAELTGKGRIIQVLA